MTAGTDYQSASGTLVFSPGETSKPINVRINGDLLVEPDETFTVNLSNATGGSVIGAPAGTGTIQNDDTASLVISQVYGGGNNSAHVQALPADGHHVLGNRDEGCFVRPRPEPGKQGRSIEAECLRRHRRQ